LRCRSGGDAGGGGMPMLVAVYAAADTRDDADADDAISLFCFHTPPFFAIIIYLIFSLRC